MSQATNSPISDAQSEYITPGEAARMVFLSTKTLSRLADEGKIASIRPGKHRRYRRTDVEALAGGAA